MTYQLDTAALAPLEQALGMALPFLDEHVQGRLPAELFGQRHELVMWVGGWWELLRCHQP